LAFGLQGKGNTAKCFFVIIKKSETKTGAQVLLRFQLTQPASRDEVLMRRGLIGYFGCGMAYSNREAVDFIVQKFSDFDNKIIPFLTNYPIIGVKAQEPPRRGGVFRPAPRRPLSVARGCGQGGGGPDRFSKFLSSC
jgi:hypothetical protein